MYKKIKKTIKALTIVITLNIINGIFYLCYYQYKTVAKIQESKRINLYEKCSIMTLYGGICSMGTIYSPLAGYANFRMFANTKDTIYIHSNKWMSPQIKKRFKENKLGKMAWNGNKDYSFFSEEKDAAILLNYCYLKIGEIKGKTCYIAECHYTWEQPSKTIFDLGIFKITVYEQLFYELEKSKMLHPYTLICYFEKENT